MLDEDFLVSFADVTSPKSQWLLITSTDLLLLLWQKLWDAAPDNSTQLFGSAPRVFSFQNTDWRTGHVWDLVVLMVQRKKSQTHTCSLSFCQKVV